MYDGIFDDFSIIKTHCKRNGNANFEESAVFELLESLVPQHGPKESVQIVIDMLDAQRVEDCKIDKKNNDHDHDLDHDEDFDADDEENNDEDDDNKDRDASFEIENRTERNAVIDADNNESNDGSIIEVEVPKKVYPFIDLTDCSPLSVIIEESNNEVVKREKVDGNLPEVINYFTDSNESNHFEEDSMDPDIIRHVKTDWNEALKNKLKSTQPPMINLLSDLEETCKSNQSLPDNSNNVEVSEILEENNNDPNNNLEGAMFDVLNTPVVEDVNINGNLNTVSPVIEELIDSIPGCSKDTDIDVMNRMYKLNKGLPSASSSGSSATVCSKDAVKISYTVLNSSDDDCDFDQFAGMDENIQDDVMCIQEIIPWADLHTIMKILKKHYHSSNRKQLTLWDLMSSESNKTSSVPTKRKHSADFLGISNKSQKIDNNQQVNNESSELYNGPVSKSPIKKPLGTDLRSVSEKPFEIESIQNVDRASNDFHNNAFQNLDFLEADSNFEISNPNESLTLFEETDNSRASNASVTDHSALIAGNATLLLDEAANLPPAHSDTQRINRQTAFPYVKPSFSGHLSTLNHERNETIVSGMLLAQAPSNSHPHTLRVIPKKEKIKPLFQKNTFFGNAINELDDSNDSETDALERPNIVRISHETGRPKIKVVHSSSHMFNPPKESQQLQDELNTEAEKLIKPAKLVINPAAMLVTNTINNPPSSLPIRPPMLNILNTSPEKQARPASEHHFKLVNNVNRVNIFNKIKEDRCRYQIAHLRESVVQRAVPRNEMRREPNLLRPSIFNDALPKLKAPTATITAAEAELLDDLFPNFPKETSKPLDFANPKSSIPKITIKGLQTNPVIAINQPSTSKATLPAENVKKVAPHSVYVRLRSMFPEVKKSYIKEICASPPLPAIPDDTGHLLNMLIDHLLREGHHNLEVEQMVPLMDDHNQPTSSLTVDEKYEYLLGIFPNADPTYLRDVVETKFTTDQALEQFIQQKLESHDYPTKEQYLAKIKITEQLKQYTSNFNVESFLELFPDPFKHFEDETRKCTHQTIALEFLKSFFYKNKVQTIAQVYRQERYNISLTAKRLSNIGQDMKTKRGNSEMMTENIPLLQEITFVKNKQKIIDYINSKKVEEETLFKELKEQNMLITCLCCYNDECMPTKSSDCNAGHTFCIECIERGTEAALSNGEAHVRCFTDCTSEFSLATLQKVLPPTKFSALLKKRQAAEVAAAEVEGLVSCPFCYFASIPPPEDKVFKCLNPECMKESCRLCKELSHVPMRCDEVIKTDEARRLIEEKMTEALLRTCYKCKKQFYKEDGCNKMTCTCGALMCYICDKPVTGYQHFNAQGGANSNLCPLWSDDRRMNAEAVRKVAEDVKNNILKTNPNLKIDTEALLPKIPAKTKGPHDDIPNANQLPEHVRRVITK